MKVRVRFFGFLRELVGKEEIDLDLGSHKDSVVVRDVVEALGKVVGADFPQKIFDLWKQHSSLPILVNGVNIRLFREFDTAVKDGDEIAIFPPGAGG